MLHRILEMELSSSEMNLLFFRWCCIAVQKREKSSHLVLPSHRLGIATEWHFSATSQGKGACDGVGGTVKRLAARASRQITTPHQLYEWAQANTPATVFNYCSQDNYNRMDIFLKDHFEKSSTINGRQSFIASYPC